MHLAFDLDGVLLDSETDRDWLDRALAAALDELGLDPSDAVLAELYPPTVERIQAVADTLGLSAERLWRVRNAHYVRVKLAAIESGELEPFEDVDALYGLAGDHQLHVISNSPGRVVESFVETYGYDDLFDACVGRGEALEDSNASSPSRTCTSGWSSGSTVRRRRSTSGTPRQTGRSLGRRGCGSST